MTSAAAKDLVALASTAVNFVEELALDGERKGGRDDGLAAGGARNQEAGTFERRNACLDRGDPDRESGIERGLVDVGACESRLALFEVA